MSSKSTQHIRHEAEIALRRRMRKGTRSCLQCRSRKIRCTYPLDSHTCHTCISHGRECIEQTYQDVKNGRLDKRVGLKQRVRELETLVQQLVEKGGADAKALQDSARLQHGEFLSPPQSISEKGHGNECHSSPAGLSTEPSIGTESSEEYDSLDDVNSASAGDSSFQKAPLMALFDNNLFLREDSKGARSPANPVRGLFKASRHGASAQARQARVAQELRRLFPPWESIQAMLEHGKDLLSLWKSLIAQQNFLGIGNLEESLREMSQSDKPVEICKALTVLSLIMQQTPENASYQNPEILNGRSQAELLQKYLDTIEAQLCSGNTVIGSLDGIECAAVLCRILFNAGRPRKSWLLYARALSFARLLGFHRPSSWRTEHEPSIGRRREQVWWHLFVGDRAVSLLLNLPYAVMDGHAGISPGSFDAPVVPGAMTNDMFSSSFYLRLGIITGRIIDRNHSSKTNPAALYAETMKLDGELHALEVKMPKKWLALSEEDGDLSGFMDMSATDIFEASNTQIWHHECRIALHMPYAMMNTQYSREAGQYEYSRTVALRSARSLIRSHLRLRKRAELQSIVCQVVDFQVFMATVLVIMDLLSRSKGAGVGILEHDVESVKDQQLMRNAYDMLAQQAKINTYKTNIPAQATKVLDTLGYLIHGQAVPGAERTNRRIVIPYFGAITIKASNALVQQREHFRAHLQKTGCSCPSIPDQTDQRPATAVDSQSLPTPQSLEPADIKLQSNQANDFTFNSFVAPPYQSHGATVMPELTHPNSAVPGLSDRPYPATSMPSFTYPQDVDIDSQMWDENVWQNMLTQDLSLDLDVDWSYLPVEGAA